MSIDLEEAERWNTTPRLFVCSNCGAEARVSRNDLESQGWDARAGMTPVLCALCCAGQKTPGERWFHLHGCALCALEAPQFFRDDVEVRYHLHALNEAFSNPLSDAEVEQVLADARGHVARRRGQSAKEAAADLSGQARAQDPPDKPTFVKKDAGKPAVSLLPPLALLSVARVMGNGAVKYSPENWAKPGTPDAQGLLSYRRIAGAAQRHILAWLAGEDADPEWGEPHLAHAACCILFLLDMELRGLVEQRDDRFKTLGESVLLDGLLGREPKTTDNGRVSVPLPPMQKGDEVAEQAIRLLRGDREAQEQCRKGRVYVPLPPMQTGDEVQLTLEEGRAYVEVRRRIPNLTARGTVAPEDGGHDPKEAAGEDPAADTARQILADLAQVLPGWVEPESATWSENGDSITIVWPATAFSTRLQLLLAFHDNGSVGWTEWSAIAPGGSWRFPSVLGQSMLSPNGTAGKAWAWYRGLTQPEAPPAPPATAPQLYPAHVRCQARDDNQTDECWGRRKYELHTPASPKAGEELAALLDAEGWSPLRERGDGRRFPPQGRACPPCWAAWQKKEEARVQAEQQARDRDLAEMEDLAQYLRRHHVEAAVREDGPVHVRVAITSRGKGGVEAGLGWFVRTLGFLRVSPGGDTTSSFAGPGDVPPEVAAQAWRERKAQLEAQVMRFYADRDPNPRDARGDSDG